MHKLFINQCNFRWGDYYYNTEDRKFLNKPTKEFDKRTFVQFILEPLYKIMGYTISYEKKDLEVIYLPY